jgi:hypothetical protein
VYIFLADPVQMILVPGIQSMNRWVWKFLWLSATNIIKYKIYWSDTGKMVSFLNKFRHMFLACTPNIILIFVFCSANKWHTLFEFPQKFTPYLISTPSSENLYLKMGNKLLTAKYAVLNLGTIWSISFFSSNSKDYKFAYPNFFFYEFICIFHSQWSI